MFLPKTASYQTPSTRLGVKSLLISIAFLSTLFSQPSFSYVYNCGNLESGTYDPQCVTNYNKNKSVTRPDFKNTVNIVRVLVNGKKSHPMGSIKNKTKKLIKFYRTISRNQLNLEIGSVKTKTVRGGSCKSIMGRAKSGERSAFLTIFSLPIGICKASHGSKKRVFLNDNHFTSFAHESGHAIGLAHAARLKKNGKVEPYGDVSSSMGRAPAINYAISQLHWLGWTEKSDIVKINTDIEQGETIEVTLRPVDKNIASENDTPVAYVYELPNATRLFISIPKSTRSGITDIKSGEIFVSKSRICKGCTGISMNTRVLKRINSRDKATHDVSGLTITPISHKGSKINGVYRVSEVTLSISLSNSTPEIDL